VLSFQGNVFGGTALSSYGGFWIGLAIILIPGGFEIEEAYGGATFDFYAAFGFYVSSQHSQLTCV
jgi:succinate-acetate transporter protein